MHFPVDTRNLAEQVIDQCRRRGHMVATAESCTGGLVAGALTEIAGSSDVVDRGFVTYSNDAKADMLGVPMPLIESVGAVSEEVARAMAEGALSRSNAAITVSVTGIAGPGGGTAQKPVGLVHFGVASSFCETRHIERRFGDRSRSEIRQASVNQALSLLLDFSVSINGL
ncbi:MAG: CinA family protein [Stappiaceae bacterium]